jgi:hypothetical protein
MVHVLVQRLLAVESRFGSARLAETKLVLAEKPSQKIGRLLKVQNKGSIPKVNWRRIFVLSRNLATRAPLAARRAGATPHLGGP